MLLPRAQRAGPSVTQFVTPHREVCPTNHVRERERPSASMHFVFGEAYCTTKKDFCRLISSEMLSELRES
jgi:hypothetical protein